MALVKVSSGQVGGMYKYVPADLTIPDTADLQPPQYTLAIATNRRQKDKEYGKEII
jgi:hypothetical protein